MFLCFVCNAWSLHVVLYQLIHVGHVLLLHVFVGQVILLHACHVFCWSFIMFVSLHVLLVNLQPMIWLLCLMVGSSGLVDSILWRQCPTSSHSHAVRQLKELMQAGTSNIEIDNCKAREHNQAIQQHQHG
jgi:hypothetical protein